MTSAAFSAAPTSTPIVRKVAEPVELSTLLSEYKDNEVRADARFKGRRVRVTGKVGDVKKDMLGDIYVTIGTGAQFEIPVVQCFVRKSQIGAASELTAKQQVTLEGTVDGLVMNVLVKDCAIVTPPDEQACAVLEVLPRVAANCRPSRNEKGEIQGYKFEAPSSGGAAGIVLVAPAGASPEKVQRFVDMHAAKEGAKSICGNSKLGVVLKFLKEPDERQHAEACKRIEAL